MSWNILVFSSKKEQNVGVSWQGADTLSCSTASRSASGARSEFESERQALTDFENGQSQSGMRLKLHPFWSVCDCERFRKWVKTGGGAKFWTQAKLSAEKYTEALRMKKNKSIDKARWKELFNLHESSDLSLESWIL